MRDALLSIRLLPAALLLAGCGGDPQPDPRAWARSGQAVDVHLPGGHGVLRVDERSSPSLREFLRVYVTHVAWVYKQKELFNRSPVALELFYYHDAATYRRIAGEGLDPRGVFLPESRTIHVPAGDPEEDLDVPMTAIARTVAQAILYDLFPAAPPWLRSCWGEVFGDGAFDKDDWLPGLPDPALWRIAMDTPERLPAFRALHEADAAELAALAEPGRALAAIIGHLLVELGKFGDVPWQLQQKPRKDAADLLEVLRNVDPRFDQRFADPLAALFLMRPDLKTYLECALVPPTPELAAKALANARAHAAIGGYWWQHADLCIELGDHEAALPSLVRCRESAPFRGRFEALRHLAAAYEASGKAEEAASVAAEIATLRPPVGQLAPR